MIERIDLVDLDGTLIDSNHFVYEQKARCLSSHFKIPYTEIYDGLKNFGLAVVLKDLGLTIDKFFEELYTPWDPIEMASIGRLKYFDDALEYLQKSHAHKYVITNSSNAMTVKKDKALGLIKHVDQILSAKDSTEAKPDTSLGEKVLFMLRQKGILDARPEMIVVGDYESDIIFGHNLKEVYPNTTILIDRDESYNGLAVPDRIIRSLTELI